MKDEAPEEKDPHATRGELVLVLGGTGHYGRQIVSALQESGHRARVLSRNPPNARALLGEGPEIAAGDVTDPAAVEAALGGVRRLVIALSAVSPALIRQQVRIERDAVLAVIEAAASKGVTRVVYLCGYEIRPSLVDRFDYRPGRIMLEVQAALAGSSLNWTVLGLAPSMEIFFATIRGDKMIFPGGGPPAFPTVSGRDVGVIAAEVAVRDDLGGRRFRVTGPEAVSFRTAAERIAQVTGKPLAFRAVPLFPLRIAAFIARPFAPFFHFMITSARLLNSFPKDLADQVPQDHALLLRTFRFVPTTLESEAKRHFGLQPL